MTKSDRRLPPVSVRWRGGYPRDIETVGYKAGTLHIDLVDVARSGPQHSPEISRHDSQAVQVGSRRRRCRGNGVGAGYNRLGLKT